MEPHSPEEYCEAALPVPLAKTFTYAVPKGMRGSVQAGCRVQAEFGNRSLTGIVLSIHRQRPRFSVRPVKKLLDDAPALTAELIELGSWIAEYYCAPIGEVLRSMLPLRGETRIETHRYAHAGGTQKRGGLAGPHRRRRSGARIPPAEAPDSDIPGAETSGGGDKRSNDCGSVP